MWTMAFRHQSCLHASPRAGEKLLGSTLGPCIMRIGSCTLARPARPAMKIAFFLTPKADVAWVKTTSTVRQAIERMEHHRYTAVPLLTPEGQYAGTLTEGDLLWFLKQNPHLRFEDTEQVSLDDVS